MKLINIDKTLTKKYFDMDKTILYCKLMPYKNNTCIKVYTENGEPIGDIEETEIDKYLQKESEVLYIKENFNDETGLMELSIETLI